MKIHEHMAPAARVKACAIKGILPELHTLADGMYPFITNVDEVIREDLLTDSPARRLRDWLLTPSEE